MAKDKPILTYCVAACLMLLCQHAISKESRNDIAKFIPKGYILFDTIYGDLNKDGLEDCVVMIKGTDKEHVIHDEYRGELDRNRRGILVLFNKKGNYELALKNDSCFSSENEDGGVYFAPELWLEIRKGNLYVRYGHGRYGYWYYTFRYQNSDFELIGFDNIEMRGPVVTSQTSVNYLTRRKIEEDNINKYEATDKEVFVKTESKIKRSNLYKFSSIKDFDDFGYEVIDELSDD